MKKYKSRKTAYLSGRTSPEFLDFLREQTARFAVSQSLLIEVAVKHFASTGDYTICAKCGHDNLNAGPNSGKYTCDYNEEVPISEVWDQIKDLFIMWKEEGRVRQYRVKFQFMPDEFKAIRYTGFRNGLSSKAVSGIEIRPISEEAKFYRHGERLEDIEIEKAFKDACTGVLQIHQTLDHGECTCDHCGECLFPPGECEHHS